METLQILGWIYLGVALGSIVGVMGLALFQGGKIASFKREINDLQLSNKILKGEIKRLTKNSRNGKPIPRKKRNWKRKPVKK
jgi:hypothetical protein